VLSDSVTQESTTIAPAPVTDKDPWPALWALVLGFFMIMVDSTIVTVATPDLLRTVHGANLNSVVWVTSAYLLAYAVPVLITGRLGDRFGQKRLYMIGLVVFTVSSLWCGLTGTIEALIIARVFQGLGASMMTPQTMAIITRIFPAERRGQAMALWGATAGVALLVGPLLGGILVDGFGWAWIFFINIPVGVVAFAMAYFLVPRLTTNPHRFDWLGVALSGSGMFLLVFGIQNAHQYNWGKVTGPITVWRLILAGLLVFLIFIYWQSRNTAEPLVPLRLFRERNFSLANVGITSISFAFTAMAFPMMLYAQAVRGLSPTKAALLMVPMALFSIVLAPGVGKLTDRLHPRVITVTGFGTTFVALVWLSRVMSPSAHVWELLIPMALMGAGSAGIWAPLSATATRNLPMQLAGAGAGVYNATRQVGAVLGSAGIALLMDSRLAAHIPGFDLAQGGNGKLPARLDAPFSKAMSDAILLPAGVILLGVIAVIFFTAPQHVTDRASAAAEVH
jgi:EmrB/QacA subfamily drug resistance transporter